MCIRDSDEGLAAGEAIGISSVDITSDNEDVIKTAIAEFKNDNPNWNVDLGEVKAAAKQAGIDQARATLVEMIKSDMDYSVIQNEIGINHKNAAVTYTVNQLGQKMFNKGYNSGYNAAVDYYQPKELEAMIEAFTLNGKIDNLESEIEGLESEIESLESDLEVAELDNQDLQDEIADLKQQLISCLLYTSPSPRDRTRSRMPSSA